MTNCTVFEEPNLQALLEKIAQEEGFTNPTFLIGNASKPGQNFIGRVFRVAITENEDGKEKSLSLVFKASSTNRARQEMMAGDRLFQTEKEMYEIVLPTLNNFLKKHGVLDQPLFPGTPRCFATELTASSDADIIVLEDKKVEGFQIVSMKTGLSGAQCRLALQRVALLHATSMALHELEPEKALHLANVLNKDYTAGGFEKAFEDLKKSYVTGLEMLDEPYKPGNTTYDKLCKITDNFGEEFMTRMEVQEDHFAITHLDCSSNNILFKINEDGSTEDACLIDFQTASRTSIANDLATLLLCCTTKEVRDEHFEKLLQYYFDEVWKTLQAFGCDPQKVFPWELFQKQLRKFMMFGLVFGIVGLPVLLADPSEIKMDIHSDECGDNLFSETAKVENPETIKELKQRLHDLVSDCTKWGYV